MGIGHDSVRLGHEVRVLFRNEGVFADERGPGERGIHVSHIDLHRHIYVARFVLVDKRGRRVKGREAVKHGRKLLVIHLNEAQCLQCGIFVDRGHCRDFIPDVPDLLRANEGLVSRVPEHPPLFAGRIRSCDDRWTPRSLTAAEVSMLSIRAWGSGLRSTLAVSIRGSLRSAVNTALPVTLGRASILGTLLPTMLYWGSDTVKTSLI